MANIQLFQNALAPCYEFIVAFVAVQVFGHQVVVCVYVKHFSGPPVEASTSQLPLVALWSRTVELEAPHTVRHPHTDGVAEVSAVLRWLVVYKSWLGWIIPQLQLGHQLRLPSIILSEQQL